jgi:hypothetical protein
MKKLLACVLVLSVVSVFVAGCKTEEMAGEHPTSEHPAETAPPKDHPAH